jgi:hypothetical protein
LVQSRKAVVNTLSEQVRARRKRNVFDDVVELACRLLGLEIGPFALPMRTSGNDGGRQ